MLTLILVVVALVAGILIGRKLLMPKAAVVQETANVVADVAAKV